MNSWRTLITKSQLEEANMSHLITRIKGVSQVAISSIGLAAMTVAAPLSTTAASARERPVQEPTSEEQQPAPDNSKKNKRDREDKNLTPLDQGKSAEDVKMTKDIRKEINQTKGISINGKNIKIITLDTVVTLRGPVASVEERQIIYDIATKIAGPTKVKNQLEVKS